MPQIVHWDKVDSFGSVLKYSRWGSFKIKKSQLTYTPKCGTER